MASVQWSRMGEQKQMSMDRTRVDLRGQGKHVLIIGSPNQVLVESDSLHPSVVFVYLLSLTLGSTSVLLIIPRGG